MKLALDAGAQGRAETGRSVSMDGAVSADEYFREGIKALAAKDLRKAAAHFRAAHELDPENARFQSYHGLGVGLRGGCFDQALALCRSAVHQEFFAADLYHNLARLHFAFDFKAEGIRYLRRGLMIDPRNRALLNHLRQLGIRRPPVLRALRRDHLLNRWLGWLRGRDFLAVRGVQGAREHA